MSAIDNLRAAVEAAAGDTAFALDAAFLTAGLADPAVKVPADYDTWLSQAFFLKAAADFKVTVAKSDVGPVEGTAFTVQSATIPFIGAATPLAAKATLVFTVDGDQLIVQAEATPSNWTWTSSFAFMGGFPFNQFGTLKNVSFVFSTATGTYPYGDSAGRAVSGGAVQNFVAKVALPDVAKPFLLLFPGLTAPAGDLLLSGALNMGIFNGETVLFPPGQLRAAIQDGTFKLASQFTVKDPSLALTIPAPDGADEVDGVLVLADPADPDAGDQAPTLAISSQFDVGSTGSYQLDVEITPGADTSYSVALAVVEGGAPLTPATVIEVMGGNGGYLAATPDVLQQFLAFVGLNGFSIAGTLGRSPTITAVSIEIGSSKDTSWQILPPTGVLDFKITSFALQWSMAYPFDGTKRQQTYDFTTEFVLAPSVFKGPDGEGDGVFTVQFTSAKQFFASFAGTAKLSDFLTALSGGAVVLDVENVGDFELGDIAVAVDYGAQSFQFDAGFSLTLNLLKINNQPILAVREGTVSIAAQTPTQTPDGGNATTLLRAAPLPMLRTSRVVALQTASQTQWKSSVGGFLDVGPLHTKVSVTYDGFETPKRWDLAASLEEPLEVSELINQFFSPGSAYGFPSFLPGDLIISEFAITATIPAEQGELKTSYDITVGFSWTFTFGDQTVGIDPARLGVSYDGQKPAQQQFSGFAQGTWVYSAINLKLTMGYEFKTTEAGSNNILFVEWEGFRADWESGKELVTFSLKGWSIGSLVQALVRTLGNPYFTLDSPWDLLNQISLDALRVNVSLKSGESFSQRLSASYELSSPINLGFISITALTFRRGTDGKVTLAIEGSSPLVADDPAFKNLLDPAKGQDVQNLPSVPGRGEEWFKLFLLVLGQRIGITGHSSFNSTKEVICALQSVPSTTGKMNPVDPNADEGGAPGLPYYDQSNNWLIAGHLGLMKVAGAWSIDAMLVFNDPNLYGLRLALAGEKMGGLANLVVDILYKKITDDIGVYQIDFTFPDIIRNLNFGAVSITLPQLGIKVYTNGDFFIDIGFPYNLDFRRSFSISVIVYGVPVLGAGGFYIGKLSNATSTKIPKTNLGTFDPVIEFGIGLQLGLGYNFEKGPLKAGFALTVFGIVEGVVAPWHPYNPARTLASRASSGALQSDYYFRLSGTVGIIGLLYGSVDFAIISASVNVKIVLSIQLTYESYREIPVIASASVTISLKVKINLGLFSISISLSFSAQVSATFVIGQTSTAPWEVQGARADALLMQRAHARGPDAAMRLARSLKPRTKRLAPAAAHRMGLAATAGDKPRLSLMAGAQYTVLAPEAATDAASNQGAFVLLLAMDAPDAAASAPSATKTSFDVLAEVYFPWIIDALGNESGDAAELGETLAMSVTLTQLEAYVARLADTADPFLSIKGLLQFLADGFTLDIFNPATAQSSGLKTKLDAGSVLFPVFDGLKLQVPGMSGGQTSPIAFETYTTATPGYATAVSKIFAQVAANIEAQNKETRRLAAETDTSSAESMAALVFVDTFTLIARQLLQAAADALQSYAYPLTPTSSIGAILDELNGIAGNALMIADIVQPNVDHALGAGLSLHVDGLEYVVQSGDTLQGIAGRYSDAASPPRWTTTPDRLIVANRSRHMLQGGVVLLLINSQGQEQIYVTRQGDSFDDVALQLGAISIDALAAQSVLYGVAGLLQPTLPLAIWPIAYKTAGTSGPSSDTLATVASLFQTTAVAVADANRGVAGLFSVQAERGLLTVANLQALSVGALWSAIAATGQVGQTAGMVSRFLVYGLRLPVQDGLTLSNAFLYPRTQSAYGVYQLTGQQFPTPSSATSYKVGFARETQSHGVPLDFILLNDGTDLSMEVDLSQAYAALDVVVSWARGPGNFVPSPTFAALPLAERQPRPFTASGYARWSSGSVASLLALTNRSGVAAAADAGAQVQPTLWSLPPAQTNLVATREQSIRAVMPDLRSTFALLPKFQPQTGRSNPATGRTDYADIARWAWCTRLDVQIKRLPDAAALAAQGVGAGDLPSGPASAPSLPFVYELVGPSSEDAVRLQRILTAMDALGEGIASAVFLLYNQSGPGAPMLVTPADANFLAFITQTNLSTETNPAAALRLTLAAEDAPPRGVANSPAQFIRLMWELSTVRSGGYYLYYENVESGEGLPAAVFDSSGSGIVTVVVTFATQGSESFGTTLPDFVNAFVTTDAVDPQSDLVQTVSLASTGQTAPVAAGASLDALAAIYGPGPGRIAEVNATKPLAAGALVPIVGAVRQLTDADLVRGAGGSIDAQATLDKLARLFSAGAIHSISGQDIAAFNPQVAVALAAVFYIPPLTYQVNASAAPGMSLASMAAYYGLDVDLIARGASAAPGLFPVNAVLDLDPQLFSLRDQLPPQNIGFSLTRDNLGLPPDDPAAPDFAKKTMYQLYTSLAAGLAGNVFYKATPLGMPFGPQDHDDDQSGAFESHARSARTRGNRLAQVALADFDYRQSIGIGAQFALVNAAPDPSDPDLPPKAANPYLGVGTMAQVALQWRDIFGNTTVTPFEAPPQGYRGALNGAAVPMLYRDELIGLGSWINTNASYSYDGTGGAAFKLALSLNAAAYAGPDGVARAADDLSLYTRIYYQLHQDYSADVAVHVPGVSGNAVAMRLSNSLMAKPDVDLSDPQADIIRGYVRACVLYLKLVTRGQAPAAPAVTLSLPVDVKAIAAGNILELDVTLAFSRNPLLVDPAVAALQGGSGVAAAILPRADGDGNVSYTVFSKAVEAVFATADWYLKVGQGLSRDGEDAADGAQQLWAVRFGKAAGQGIHFKLGTSPSYFAPKPIAKALASGGATITRYDSGDTDTLHLDGVDLNQWFQSALDAIDQFLSADYAPHAFILDRIDGVTDPIKDGSLGSVLSAKESLADTISLKTLPVLSTSAGDPSTGFAASEKLRQQLLNQLGAAYRAGAAVVFGLTEVTGGGDSNPAGPPNLYGQPGGSIKGVADNQNFTLTPTRIPLGEVYDSASKTWYDPRLAFVFATKNVVDQAYVPLELTLSLTHLEFERRTVPGIDGYVDSRWLAFVNGPFSYPLGTQVTNIPVVNRDLPTPPTVSAQQARQLTGEGTTDPSKLNAWGYSFDYLYQQAAADAVSCTMEFNRPTEPTLRGSAKLSGEPDLFTALAQFVTNYPAILRDLNQYLVGIDGAEPDPATLAAARKATAAFALETRQIADAYARETVGPARLAVAPAHVIVKFLSTLDSTSDGHARTNLVNITIDGVAASWNAAANTISNGTTTLPAPVIAIIAPELYTPQAVPPAELPPGVEIAYVYTRQVDGKTVYLREAEARGLPARTVSIAPLDVLLYQSGWASVFVQRNLALFPLADLKTTSTNPAFLFQTPEVRFASTVVPQLNYTAFSLDAMSGASGDLDARLTKFFAGLYADGNGSTSDEVAMQGMYSYEVVAGQPAIPRVRLPINLLTPTPSAVDPGVKPPFVAPFAQMIDTWRATTKPTTSGHARVEIELKVFGGVGDATQPLIQVGRLTHDIASA
ncbi:LysM domain-containing protein [Bradyrhizobium sp. SZCCHNS3053]|uniref:LysM peptidoglycan-binding domain-containing protein n=1 Tax=Bradyrhizobium sp. SZCCHNS3053 TaxID=3057322 RepID=UPI002916DFAC|nr:LysM domain-containing protein [Bradyrhizobium sp. SZCCHNS3053]